MTFDWRAAIAAIVRGGTASGARRPPSFVILRVIPPPGAAVGIGAGVWPFAGPAAARAAAAKQEKRRRRVRERAPEWDVIRRSDGRQGDLPRTRMAGAAVESRR